MRLDKAHPKYPEYAEKFQELMRRGKEESNSVPVCDGLDGPVVAVHRKYVRELKELRKEYSYLFAEEVSAGQDDP